MKSKYLKTQSYVHKQQGFVLVLVLVLLTILTLIGISSMNSASIEMKATANARQHQVAFNAVQSVLEYAISSEAAGPLIDYQISDKALTQTVSPSIANVKSLKADVVLTGCSVAVGNSLESGKGFTYNYFLITGNGSNSTGSSTSTQGQGVRYPSASC